MWCLIVSIPDLCTLTYFIQPEVLILGDDSSGCYKVGDYFATEADIVCEVDLNKVSSKYLHLTGTFIKVSCLNMKLLFSIYISIYFSIRRIRKYA